MNTSNNFETSLLEIVKYCDGDIMCNQIDIANIKAMAKRALSENRPISSISHPEEKEYKFKSSYKGLIMFADFLRQLNTEDFDDIIENCNLDYHSCATKNKIIGVLLEKMMTPKKRGWFN